MPRRWVTERHRDPYYRAAQREGLRSRAAFKLGQLNERFHLLRRGDRVLDLGASPGGWSTVARNLVGPEGQVVAVDMRSFEPIEGVMFLRGRVGDPALLDRLGSERFQVVLSDMSPTISGNYSTDHARSVDLVRSAFGVAQHVLEPGGTFVAKLFDGDLTGELRKDLGESFVRLSVTKPGASRSQSSEVYLLGQGFSEESG
jgi:23S rRNA (uridine2552-2'-O)-methyltransferase